ncbi:MAG: polysaccharide biosynthesis/export family protein [Hyphomicrobiaceae bacterium]
MSLRCTSLASHLLRLAVLAVVATVGACAEGSGSATERPSAVRNANLAEPRVYRLGVGDKVKVIVFGETDLSGNFDINAAGHIAMPLAGDIPARGLSPTGLKDAIVRRLSDGYLKNPKVSVEVLTYRAVFVHGEVKSGGEFAFKHGLKIRDAIAVAGGYTYRANQSYVLVTREDDPREIRIDLPSSVMVMPGDNIRVPERFF